MVSFVVLLKHTYIQTDRQTEWLFLSRCDVIMLETVVSDGLTAKRTSFISMARNRCIYIQRLPPYPAGVGIASAYLSLFKTTGRIVWPGCVGRMD